MITKNLKTISGTMVSVILMSSVAMAATDMPKMEKLDSLYENMNTLDSNILLIQALQHKETQLQTRDQAIEQLLSNPQSVETAQKLDTELQYNEQAITGAETTLRARPSIQSEQEKLGTEKAEYETLKQSLSAEDSQELHRQELQSALNRIEKLKSEVDALNSKVDTYTGVDTFAGVVSALLGFASGTVLLTALDEHGVSLPGGNSGFGSGPFIALGGIFGAVVGGYTGNHMVHFIRTRSAQKQLTQASSELALLQNQYAISLQAYNALYPVLK